MMRATRREFLAIGATSAILAAGAPASHATPRPIGSNRTITPNDRAQAIFRTFQTLTRYAFGNRNDSTSKAACNRAIDQLSREIPIHPAAISSLKDYAFFQVAIGSEAPDAIGKLLGTNAVQFAGTRIVSTPNSEYQIIMLVFSNIIDDTHTWVEFVPVVLTLDHSDVLQLQVLSDSDLDVMPPRLRNVITELEAHNAHSALALPDPGPSAEKLLEEESRMHSLTSLRSVGSSGRHRAAAYANKYWRSYNPAYRRFDGNRGGGDCTNFVSQCMAASGWGYTGNLVWKNTDRSWFYLQWPPYTSASWVNVGKFRSFALANKRTRLASHYYDMWHGNVIQYGYGTAWHHSTIVTGRSGKQPLLTYHSKDTHNKPFFAFKKDVDSAGRTNHWDRTIWALHLT